ncbi:MAG: hypothetical protein WCI05_03165 [Myxococcales bacterium]
MESFATGAGTGGALPEAQDGGVAYSGRGTSLDSEGPNRSINVALATVRERQAANPITPNDPDILAGQNDVEGPDGPNNQVNTGFLWDSALRNNLAQSHRDLRQRHRRGQHTRELQVADNDYAVGLLVFLAHHR